MSAKAARIKEKIDAVHDNLPEDAQRFMEQSQDRGASSWVNAIPIEEEGFNVNKQEFFDALRLRYNLPLPGLPPVCACGKPYSVFHAHECSKGGFVNRRHDNLRDLFVRLLNEVCTNVQAEPHLLNLSGEVLQYATAIRGDDARLDIRARGFWRSGQDAFFDVRVTHVNAESQRHLSTKTIFNNHQQEKKRHYNQRCMDQGATFTALIFGTNGGVGKECSMFMARLAELLSVKRNEEYNDVMNWLRTKVSVEVVKSALLCVRGSRTPWIKKEVKVSEDFGLSVVTAGL